MISVILSVLKILGIALCVILGILLLLIGLLLFVPIRYRANGEYQSKKVNITGRITWLLHIVSAKIFFEIGQPFHIKIQFLGIPVYDNLKKALKEEKSIGKNKKNKKTNKKKNKNDDEYTDTEIQAASSDNIKQEPVLKEDTSDTEASQEWDEYLQTRQADDSVSGKTSFIQKIKNFIGKIIQFLKNIKYTFHRICDTITKIRNNIRHYWDLLQQDSTKLAIAACKTQLVRIIRNLLPQKYQVHLHLGFEDPAVMGEIMAVWGILYPFHEGRIDIVPEFGQAVAEADFVLKGRITLYVYIRTAIIIYFDKNVKQLINQLKA